MAEVRVTNPPTIPISDITKRREVLVAARDQARLQLNGLENQNYILDQLLNPEPAPAPAPAPEPEPAPAPAPAPEQPGIM
jgi:hypothetical protein